MSGLDIPKPVAPETKEAPKVTPETPAQIEAQKQSRQQELAQLKAHVDLPRTKEALKGETFSYKKGAEAEFKAQLEAKLNDFCSKDPEISKLAPEMKTKIVEARVAYIQKSIAVQAFSTAGAGELIDGTVTVVIGPDGEPKAEFKGKPENVAAAQEDAEKPIDPKAYAEFKKGDVGTFSTMVLGFLNPKSEGESDADYAVRLDGELQKAFAGGGILGAILYFSHALPAGTKPFWAKFENTELGKKFSAAMEEICQSLGISEKVEPVDKKGFERVLNIKGTIQKDGITIKEEKGVVIPADVMVTVKTFSPGEEMKIAGKTYEQGKKYEGVSLSGVTLPQKTILTGGLKVERITKESENKEV